MKKAQREKTLSPRVQGSLKRPCVQGPAGGTRGGPAKQAINNPHCVGAPLDYVKYVTFLIIGFSFVLSQDALAQSDYKAVGAPKAPKGSAKRLKTSDKVSCDRSRNSPASK